MPRPPARRPIVALALLLLSGPTAGGAAIPSYTVTDLGVEDFKVPLPAGDDATVTASDGRVYAFPRSIGDLVAPPEAYQTLKPPTPWSHEPYAYSFLDRSPGGGFLSSNGVYVGTVLSGIEGHTRSASSDVSVARLQSDGSFGHLQSLWGTVSNRESPGVIATAIDINKNDEVLGFYARQNTPQEQIFLTYDIKTGILSELPFTLDGWFLGGRSLQGGAPRVLDDQGRILVFGSRLEGSGTSDPEHALLLTPAGVSSDPIATPEPSTLATLAVAIAGLAYRRHRKQPSSI